MKKGAETEERKQTLFTKNVDIKKSLLTWKSMYVPYNKKFTKLSIDFEVSNMVKSIL